jgi:hypothetical protein
MIMVREGSGTFQQLIFHADDSRPDEATTSQRFPDQNGMRMATQPPYSPDIMIFVCSAM